MVSRTIFERTVVGAVDVWWSCLCVCVSNGSPFNRSSSALDGNEELEATSLYWRSLDLDSILTDLSKTCEGRSSLVLSPLLDLHIADDSDSICKAHSAESSNQGIHLS